MASNAWKDTIFIRPATKEDIPSVLWMIQMLAEYENEPSALKIGEKELLQDGFGEEKYFHLIVAELKSDPPAVKFDPDQLSSKMPRNERLVGYVLYFFNYSTWEGRVLYLEDLFVREHFRNNGLGTALMRECAKVARARNCARMVWQVLDWNTKALELYERIGGKYLREWLTVRMDRSGMENFIFSDH